MLMLSFRAFRIALVVYFLFNIVPAPIHAAPEDSEEDSAFTESEIEPGVNEETPDVEVSLDKTKKDKKTIIRTVRRSDSLLGILTSNGFTTDEVYGFLALPSWPKHYTLTPSARYLVSTYKDNTKNVELIFFMQRSAQVLKLTKEEGKTEFSISDLNFELRVRQITGDVQGSLFGSIRKYVPDGWVVTRFLDAYSLDYKLDKQVRKGAKFSITYEEKLLNGQYVAPGEVLYTSVDIDGKKQERFFLKSNQGGAFLALDAGHDMRPFYAPIEYLHISSPFNLKRFHPIRRRRIPHKGTDFALNHGSTVYAALDGTVARMGRNKAAGMFIVLKHQNGYQTDYVHLSEVDPKINVGVEVKTGQKLGEVGCTGFCTRPHLHFGISKNGQSIDPIKFMKPYTYQDEPQLKAFADCVVSKSNSSRNAADVCTLSSANKN
jgi:murein DD-endopeptidase MepM/ murein hydrolase activator NlpD